jgi:hypothetical protein
MYEVIPLCRIARFNDLPWTADDLLEGPADAGVKN